MPLDPGPLRWALPDAAAAPDGREDLAVGADLAPATLLAGYGRGLFPMPDHGRLVWWSPDPRGVIGPDGVHISRSLRRAARGTTVSVNQAFDEVLRLCAHPDRSGAWITEGYAASYRSLRELGWAHSVEVWREDDLIGGLFGIEIGGLFCGESMVRQATDGSKLALWATASLLAGPDSQQRLFDVQWLTPHLARMGAIEIPRSRYLARLQAALELPPRMLTCARLPAEQILAG